MIKKMTPLSLAEVKELVKDSENADIKGFIKKFEKGDLKKSDEIKNELESLDLVKLKKMDIVKIIDLLPEDSSDLNKIVTETSLDENETEKILGVIKKYT